MAPSATIPPLNGHPITPATIPSKQALIVSSIEVQDDSQTTPTTGITSVISRLSNYKNPSLYVTTDHKVELRDTPVPTPTSTQVLIHVRATGICGSDLHLWHTGAIGPLVVDQSSILGHEAAGVVLAVGSAVTNLKAGDRVAIEPGVPCHDCFLCAAGKYNLCESVAFAGVCPYAGTIRRFMTHEARYCHKMPDTMTFKQGALLEPLSVILHALSQCAGSLQLGKPALVCGAGPIGLIALAAAKASGAWPLVITDMEQSRLDFAQQLVPGVQTYQIQTSKTPIESAEDIRLLFGCRSRNLGQGALTAEDEYKAPSTVLECTGVESSVITAAYSCRRAGTVMVIGVGRSIMNNLPFMHLSLAEIDLKFTNRYSDTWPAGSNVLSGKVLDLDSLVTHTIPLERAVDAMNICADRSQKGIKIQIVDDMEIEM